MNRGYTDLKHQSVYPSKRMKMKKIFIITVCSFMTVCSYGQLYRYSYDAAGNRTVRRYSLNNMSVLNEDDETGKEVKLSQMLQEHQVNISTDEEEINVRVSNMDKDTRAEIAVFDVSGIQVAKTAIREEETKIDMSGQKTGVYVARVTVDGKSTSWKIAKE